MVSQAWRGMAKTERDKVQQERSKQYIPVLDLKRKFKFPCTSANSN